MDLRVYGLRAPVGTSACRAPSARTTGCRSPRPTRSTASAGWRCGGCASALRSNGSARTSRAERPPRAHASDAEEGSDQARRRPTCCSSRPASMPSRPATTGSGRTRRSAMKVPGRTLHAVRRASYRGLAGRSTIPFHDWTATVTNCGRICLQAAEGESEPGLRRAGGRRHARSSERVWLVTFMHYDLGYFDDETCRLEPIENPFGPKVLPMCPE